MFKRIHFDTVPAIDVERARDFYRDKLGFAVERDNPYGDSRWVFMRIPGADTLLHFDKQDERSENRRRRRWCWSPTMSTRPARR